MRPNLTKIKHPDDARELLKSIHGVADEKLVIKLMEAIDRNVNPKTTGKVPRSDYWADGAIYITCPITGMRKSRIDKRHTALLGLTDTEYYSHIISLGLTPPPKESGFMAEMNAKLNVVNPATGLSSRQVGSAKTKITRSAVNPLTGVNNYQTTGLKTQAGLLGNIDQNGLNAAQRGAILGRINQHRTMDSTETWSTRDKFDLFVRWLGSNIKASLSEGEQVGIMGTAGNMQVDHIYPVLRGFDTGVSPWALAHPENLQLVPYEENASGLHNDRYTIAKLLEATGITDHDSNEQFQLVVDVIDEMTKFSSPAVLIEFNTRYSRILKQYQA